MRIALLEDDRPQAELIQAWLKAADHRCHHYEQGGKLLGDLGRESFDLILLDWILPDMEGIEVLARIRHHLGWSVPVLFVTGRDSEDDIAWALEQGADDYLIKPLRRQELLARINAVSRRGQHQKKGLRLLEFGYYTFDTEARTAYRNGMPVALTEREFDLALFLFGSEGRVLSRGHILECVWEDDPDISPRNVDTHISRVRRKLALGLATGWQLQTVYQQGYRLERLKEPTPEKNLVDGTRSRFSDDKPKCLNII